MGWFDRAKAALGVGQPASGPSSDSHRGKRGERPPLRDVAPASPGASLDDALEARESGRVDEARAILQAIDKGRGLRTVLRAAAALEAGDQEELAELRGPLTKGEPAWRLALQTALALEGGEGAANGDLRPRLIAFAANRGAPPWAIGWTAGDAVGRVQLLFDDAPLARTVAARDWKVPGAQDDRAGIERYATFAHGRDAIRRFGPDVVARLVAYLHDDATVAP